MNDERGRELWKRQGIFLQVSWEAYWEAIVFLKCIFYMLQSFNYACNECNILSFFVFSDNQQTYSIVIWCLTSEF